MLSRLNGVSLVIIRLIQIQAVMGYSFLVTNMTTNYPDVSACQKELNKSGLFEWSKCEKQLSQRTIFYTIVTQATKSYCLSIYKKSLDWLL